VIKESVDALIYLDEWERFWVILGHAFSRPDFSSRDGIGTRLSAAAHRSVGSGLKPDPTERCAAATILRPAPSGARAPA